MKTKNNFLSGKIERDDERKMKKEAYDLEGFF
jgi:hypothetical protein